MALRSKRATWFIQWSWLVCVACFGACSEDTSDGLQALPTGFGSLMSGNGAQAGTMGASGMTGQSSATAVGGNATASGISAAGRGGSGASGAAGGKGGSSSGGKSGTGTGGKSTGGSGGKGSGTGGAAGTASNGETGRMVGMTAAHNVVRAEVETQTPLPDLTWSSTLAAYAQEWTDNLAKTCNPQHRSSTDLQKKGYGENLAMFGSGGFGASQSTAQKAVDGWAGEVECWTYGAFMTGDNCDVACYTAMNSDGCGHYTQIVWRKSTQVGCGVSTCTQGAMNVDIWVCNYAPAGNYVGQNPY